MVDWREKAEEMLPELKEHIKSAETPMGLWIEIRLAFEKAYRLPHNESFIRRTYQFASWSMMQPEGEGEDAGKHLPTCAAVCFYEHLPVFKPARDDLSRWMTRQQVLNMKSIFLYHTTEADFNKLLSRLSDKSFEIPKQPKLAKQKRKRR